jgi:hypothetical protein
MPSQKITIVKVVGVAGKRLMGDFARFAEGGRTNAEEYEGVQIMSIEDQRRIDRLIDGLRRNSLQPPIVFFNEHVDSWSFGGDFDSIFPGSNSGYLGLWFDSTEIRCCSLPDENQLLDELKKRSASRRASIPQELRWYWTILQQAVRAWDSLVIDATIVVIRDVIGGLVDDEEIEKSMTTVPMWLDEVSPP